MQGCEPVRQFALTARRVSSRRGRDVAQGVTAAVDDGRGRTDLPRCDRRREVLTAADVRAKRFAVTKFHEGYDQREVDRQPVHWPTVSRPAGEQRRSEPGRAAHVGAGQGR
ncbi:DivIVA domain-containing protein [Aquipuribacter sp. SD81]|uniref:DivIVA domain-containing protein n=1 Tax=Aquipuribacter sp. SD81 TaxID=3127703 RepID=UPI003FA5D685